MERKKAHMFGLSPIDSQRLDDLAAAEQASRSETIRKLILIAHEKRGSLG